MKKLGIKKIVSIVAILVIGVLGMTVLSDSKKHSQKKDNKPPVRTVNTQILSFGNLNLEITGNGIVESKSILDVVSEVSGKIEFAKNNLKDGTYVKKGETVIKIDAREIENNLFSFRSDFVNAVATILPDLKVEGNDLYKKWFDYFSIVDIHKDIPNLPKISNLQEKIKLSSRQIFTKYYKVKNQEILLSKCVINAPYTGYIKSKGVIENSFISRGQNLFIIEDVNNLEIEVPLLVDEFNHINFNSGAIVEITSDNTNDVINGRLIRKDPVLNPNSQSLSVYVAYSNYDMIPEFLAGNYVNVKITGRKLSDVAAIPRHLVTDDKYIFTIEDGKLTQEELDIVEIQKDKLIISDKYEKELEIVTTILQKPLIGMPIKSLNHVAELDSSDLNSAVAVK